MRKKLPRALTALMLALALCVGAAACGEKEETPPPDDGNKQEEQTPPPEDVDNEPVDVGVCTVTAFPAKIEMPAGQGLEVSSNVQQNFSAVEDLESAGLKLIWSLSPDGNTDADITENDGGSGNSLTALVTAHSVGTYYIVADLQDMQGNSLYKATVELTSTEPPEEAPEPVEASIYVPFVTADPDFIRGTDVSSLLVVLNSGARFKDWDGNSLGDTVEQQGPAFMKLLKDAGVNWIRLRVWNDPYDAEGHGYGGGNNDVQTAVTIGKWATDAGLRVLIDFHYSDFWADPAKQMVPKAWAEMDIDTKTQALSDFTKTSLNTLLDAGVDVGMVQVGNETTTGICGEKDWNNMGKLFAAGCDAVHEVASAKGRTILAAVHFTNPEKGNYHAFAAQLDSHGVNYDVFASSYYPEWHGTLDNLYTQLKFIADRYGKQVMVAETSCPYTYEDGDGNGASADPNGYPVSVQGQATEFASVAKTVRSVGKAGIGIFYWENAWIPAVNISGLTGEELENAKAENARLWEEFGSGWASSWAGSYDPDDAGKYYGGPAMDNKAMFDFNGKPLESLKVFKYMQTGTTGYVNEITTVPTLAVDALAGGTLELPQSVNVIYTDTTEATIDIVWDQASVDAVDMNALGSKFTVTGKVYDSEGEADVSCVVTIVKANFIVNPSFEDGDTGYTLENWPGDKINSKNSGDTVTGSWCLHFWKSDAIENAKAYQTVTLEPGTYLFSMSGQGGDQGENNLYIFANVGGSEITERFELDGYHSWKTPSLTFTVETAGEVTVGVSVTAGAGAWGTFDDWTLYKAD